MKIKFILVILILGIMLLAGCSNYENNHELNIIDVSKINITDFNGISGATEAIKCSKLSIELSMCKWESINAGLAIKEFPLTLFIALEDLNCVLLPTATIRSL